MSTAAVRTPQTGSGRKNERGSFSIPADLKNEIKAAAGESGMYASSYLELLLQSEFPEALPRLVMVSIGRDGTKREIPVGVLKSANVQMAEEQKMARATYTISPQLQAKIEDSAKQSHLNASAYLRRLLSMKFSDGLPRFGVAMFDLEDLSEGTLTMA